jgi:hypothetical protein
LQVHPRAAAIAGRLRLSDHDGGLKDQRIMSELHLANEALLTERVNKIRQSVLKILTGPDQSTEHITLIHQITITDPKHLLLENLNSEIWCKYQIKPPPDRLHRTKAELLWYPA